jgi:hypothetical protein
VSPRSLARKPIPPLVSIAVLAAVAWPYWWWLYRLCASLHYNDFGKFYYGVLAWREGRSLYSLSPASFIPGLPNPLTNLNPPHAMLPVWPLTFLPVDWAFALWMVVNGACLLGVTTIVCRTVEWRPSFFQLTVLMAGAPTATWLVTGQLSGLMAVPLTFAWLAWRSGRLRAAGLWLGVAASVKPFLGLLVLWMLWRREWRALQGIAYSGLAAFLCGLLVFGVAGHSEWLAATWATSWTWSAMNASLLGIVTRALTVTPYHVPFGIAAWLVVPIWLPAVAGISVLLARRLRGASVDDAWGLLVAGALLISPLGWTYYLWWMLPGLQGLTKGVTSVLLLLPLPVVALTVFTEKSPLLSFTIGSAYGWALLWSFLAIRPVRGGA